MCCSQDNRPSSPQAVKARQGKAFSLVEIMIVIVIIGMLAGVVSLSVGSTMNRAKKNTARHEIATLMHATEIFYAATGRYPTNDEGIGILARPSPKCPEKLIDSVPVDPWGHPYQYNCPGTNAPYEIICYGADGKEGGEGSDADISSTDLKEK
jgi:general secretion pathway protein G